MKSIGYSFISLITGFVVAYLLFTRTEMGMQNIKPLNLGILNFADSSVYEGGVVDGLMSGQGKLSWSNGVVYTGEFKNGLLNGYGKFTYPSGIVHEGQFVNGLAEGEGKIIFENGAIYEGQFKADREDGRGRFIYSNGDIYEGDFRAGSMEGKGKWIIPGSHTYVGDVKAGGIMHGQGQINYENGNEYTGNFDNGLFSGQGIYKTLAGVIYSGSFVEGKFEGEGTYTKPGYGSLVGSFKNWYAEGQGVRTDDEGNQWQGNFVKSQLEGEGVYIGVDGEYYKGGFEYGYFNGQGQYINKNGDQYIGGFKSGRKHGEGTYTFKEEKEGVKEFNGRWNFGKLVEGDENMVIFSGEKIGEYGLYQQSIKLEEALSAVKNDDDPKTNLYLLAIAGWGDEEVFNREIKYIKDNFEEKFQLTDRSIYLVNSRRDIHTNPFATTTSIKQSIEHLAQKMDRENDILMIYATSHGDQEAGFGLQHNGIALPDLEHEAFKKILSDSGIKHKVVVISACYSGVFMDYLKDDSTMVMTASSADKRSFGCADDSDFTYFGKALFKHGLAETNNFKEAFNIANQLISEWETEDDLTPSEPMIHSSAAIEQKLQSWQTGLQ